jgi:Protein of unknown function (DUF3221)
MLSVLVCGRVMPGVRPTFSNDVGFHNRLQVPHAYLVLPLLEGVGPPTRAGLFHTCERRSYMRKLILILIALTLSAACLRWEGRARSSSHVDVRGTITRLSLAQGDSRGKVLGHVLIEGEKEADTQVDKASLTVTAETKLFIKHGKERKSVEFADLEVGQKAEARFIGPVMESYPVQAKAGEITVLEE